MHTALKMATSSCIPNKFRGDNSDEEVNQEVPVPGPAGGNTGSIQKQPSTRPPLPQADPTWSTLRHAPPAPAPLPTAEASKEYNWQAGMTNVREKNSVMYNNSLMADVYFTVGNDNNKQRIPAHQYVLATGSSVFYAMFYGGLADKKEEISLPDVEPIAFQNLLR